MDGRRLQKKKLEPDPNAACFQKTGNPSIRQLEFEFILDLVGHAKNPRNHPRK